MFIRYYVETRWLIFKSILKISLSDFADFDDSSTSLKIYSELSDDIKVVKVLFKVMVRNGTGWMFNMAESLFDVSSLS